MKNKTFSKAHIQEMEKQKENFNIQILNFFKPPYRIRETSPLKIAPVIAGF